MALLPVMTWGNPVLKQRAKEITQVDEELRQLASDMFETMKLENGVGLAANQIGVLKRVFVVDVPQEVGPSIKHALLNPVITRRSKKHESQEEGCLSFPGIYGPVDRAYEVEIEGYNLEWEKVTLKGSGLLARAFQHELDHLDGIVFVERMSMLNRTMLSKPLRELAKKTKAELISKL